MSARIGVIGLGAMGRPIARRLLQAGFQVTVCPHRNRQPVEELSARGARTAENPAEIAAASEVVITSVPSAPQVEKACFGDDGIAAGQRSPAAEGLTVIDMSTTTPAAAVAIASRLSDRGIAMLDAPVSGGPGRAETGELTIMVGGDAEVLSRHRPVLEALGSNLVHVGENGHGQIAKLANNAIIGTLMPALAESLTFAARAGADPKRLREVLLTSTASNWLLEHWLPQNLLQDSYEGGFATELMEKDLSLVLEAAGGLGVPMFEAALSRQLFAQAKGLGYGREDFSAVGKLYQDAANVTVATGKPQRPEAKW